ncbi:hypothetical protein, partial [Ochrobactrum sp. SFR4]|uniref:hypothetical protein n=1 Tax=Ochrobactrum sp. SFR4 TaxID=2717368 RepID=UPI001C8C5ECC
LMKNYLAKCDEGPPLLRHLNGQRIFELVLVTVSWRWARSIESRFGTRRLQPQMRVLILVAVMAGAWPVYQYGLFMGPLTPLPVDPV